MLAAKDLNCMCASEVSPWVFFYSNQPSLSIHETLPGWVVTVPINEVSSLLSWNFS